MICRSQRVLSLAATVLIITLSSPLNLTAQEDPAIPPATDSLLIMAFIDGYPDYLETTDHQDDPRTRLAFLQRLQQNQVIVRFGYQLGLDDDPAIRLAAYHAWLDMLADQVGRRLLLERVSSTAKALDEAYRFGETALHTWVIRSPDSLSGLAILDRLTAGERFENLAFQNNGVTDLLDTPWDLGWKYPADLEPAYARAAYRLKPGEISGPVRTGPVFSIIHLKGKNFSPSHGHFGRIKRQQVLRDEIGERVDLAAIYSNQRVWVAQQKIQWKKRRLRRIFKNRLLAADDPIAKADSLDAKILNSVLFLINKRPFTFQWIVDHLALLPPDANLAPTELLEGQDLILDVFMLDHLLKQVHSLPEGDHWLMAAEEAATRTIHMLINQRMVQNIMNGSLPPDTTLIRLWGSDSSRYLRPALADLEEIVLPDSETADDLQRQIIAGGSMAKLAARYTLRDWARPLKGRLGWVPAKMYGALADSLIKAPPGTLIGPVKIHRRYLFIKIWNNQPAQWLPETEVLPRLRLRWLRSSRDEAIADWINDRGLGAQKAKIDTLQLLELGWPEAGLAPLADRFPAGLP